MYLQSGRFGVFFLIYVYTSTLVSFVRIIRTVLYMAAEVLSFRLCLQVVVGLCSVAVSHSGNAAHL